MSNVTQYFGDGHRIDAIVPKSRSDDMGTVGWLSMRDYHKAAVLVSAGAIAAGGLIDCKITQAQDDAGTGAKDISGKAITTLTGSDDNALCLIELDSSELDVSNNFDYINVELSCGGNVACLTAAYVFRYESRFQAVDDTNLQEHVTA